MSEPLTPEMRGLLEHWSKLKGWKLDGAIAAALAKLDELQAENERLTRERDEARAEKVLAERYAARVDEARRTAERERDEALAAMNADVADVVLAKCVAEARAALAEAEEPKPASSEDRR